MRKNMQLVTLRLSPAAQAQLADFVEGKSTGKPEAEKEEKKGWTMKKFGYWLFIWVVIAVVLAFIGRPAAPAATA